MKAYYRLSDNGYNKIKPQYVTTDNCLNNFLNHFGDKSDITLICDNVKQETFEKMEKKVEEYHINCYNHNEIPSSLNCIQTHGNSSAGGFRICIDMALKDKSLNAEDIIFFVEGDYIFRKGSYDALMDGFNLGADIISLYNHPDKFIPASKGGNPLVEEDGGQATRVYRGNKAYWMLIDSACCTWATKLKTLRLIAPIIAPFIAGTYPRDIEYFHELRRCGYSLVQPMPTFSTHGETQWISSLIGTEYAHLSDLEGWERIILNT